MMHNLCFFFARTWFSHPDPRSRTPLVAFGCSQLTLHRISLSLLGYGEEKASSGRLEYLEWRKKLPFF